MYGVLAWAIAGPATLADPDTTVVGLYLAAAALCILSFFVPRLISSRGSSLAEERAAGAMRASIVQWAMLEAVAILGLVAGLLRENSFFYFPLGVVAFLGILLSRPTSDDSHF